MSDAITVLFDFKDPNSYLAVAPTLALATELGIECRWRPFLGSTVRAPLEPGPDASRGEMHRWHRACYRAQDLVRYSKACGLPARHFGDGGLYRETGGEVAAMGYNWLADRSVSGAGKYLRETFPGYWDGELDLDSVTEIEGLIESCGGSSTGFAAYCETSGPDFVANDRDALIEQGAFTTPAYLVEDDVYVGRQHLPMVRWRLGGSVGPAPV